MFFYKVVAAILLCSCAVNGSKYDNFFEHADLPLPPRSVALEDPTYKNPQQFPVNYPAKQPFEFLSPPSFRPYNNLRRPVKLPFFTNLPPVPSPAFEPFVDTFPFRDTSSKRAFDLTSPVLFDLVNQERFFDSNTPKFNRKPNVFKLLKKELAQLHDFVKLEKKFVLSGRRQEAARVFKEAAKNAKGVLRLAQYARVSYQLFNELRNVNTLAEQLTTTVLSQLPTNLLYRQVERLDALLKKSVDFLPLVVPLEEATAKFNSANYKY